MIPRKLVLGLFLASVVSTVAQTPATAPAIAPPAPAAVNHDFDFWIGEWEVRDPQGVLAGTSRIESVAGGHGLLENWQGAPPPGSPAGTNGGDGKSLNAFDRSKQRWQQFWIGSGGGVLELTGGLAGGKMVLSGEHDVRARHVVERITWTPNPDGSVRQLWEQSTDGQKSWQIAFDGRYTRKK